jgi:hypothetical protein
MHWSTHRHTCHEPNSSSRSLQSVHINTPEGYQLQLCSLHQNEVCSLCSSNYSSTNAKKRFDELLSLSQKVLEQEEQLSRLTLCSNSNCQSRWEATENFIPPVILPSVLRPCLSCRHAVYCSPSCQHEHLSEHQMICRLYTQLFRDQREGTCHRSYCLGTVLEEIFGRAETTTETGLRLKIIFFNGDIDPSSSLCQRPYYLCEYISLPTEQPLMIHERDVSELAISSDLSWRRLSPAQPYLERYLHNEPTGTYVQIVSSSVNESGENLYSAVPWVRGQHLGPPSGETNAGALRGMYVVLECQVVHSNEGTLWRRVDSGSANEKEIEEEKR